MKLLHLFALAAPFSLMAATEPGNPPIRIEHRVQTIEGSTVHVDTSLLEGEHKETGDLALRIMDERPHQIALRLPAGPVARMRDVPIYFDRDHPLGNAHYHPDADWLESRGYDQAMAKAVHITGSVLLHELAHSYHERVLDFGHEEIIRVYQQFCDSRKFDRTPHVSGRSMPHYGLTDHKEYFAEMTETFFVGNGYFPFNHYQLHQEHPASYQLIATIWGTDIKPPVADGNGTPSILDLRIQANLLSQRGDYEEALKLVDTALKRDGDGQGRLGGLRKEIEARRAESAAKPAGR